MENLGYSGAMNTPSLASLAHSWAYASRYYATTHPSLPNYLSLIGGSTFGISSDCVFCFVNKPNLPTELSDKGITWSAYMESIPTNCYLSPYASNRLYAGKHDPFIYFDNIRSSPSLCNNIKPLSELRDQLKSDSANIPAFTWITPNICNDGHSCPPAVAGAWLNQLVTQITNSTAWKNNGALYVTWDEGNGGDHSGVSPNGSITAGGGGGHVLTLVIEPGIKGGTVLNQPLNHYALLKTVETNFNVGLIAMSNNSNLATLP